jgi:hypothetical protein
VAATPATDGGVAAVARARVADPLRATSRPGPVSPPAPRHRVRPGSRSGRPPRRRAPRRRRAPSGPPARVPGPVPGRPHRPGPRPRASSPSDRQPSVRRPSVRQPNGRHSNALRRLSRLRPLRPHRLPGSSVRDLAPGPVRGPRSPAPRPASSARPPRPTPLASSRRARPGRAPAPVRRGSATTRSASARAPRRARRRRAPARPPAGRPRSRVDRVRASARVAHVPAARAHRPRVPVSPVAAARARPRPATCLRGPTPA